MKERIVKIKDSTTGEVHEFTVPFAIKETDHLVTAFLETHFETVSRSAEYCRLCNYNKLNTTCFSEFKEITLTEYYDAKNIALGFDTSPQVSESAPAQETVNKPTVEKKITLKFLNGTTQELTTPCAFYFDSRSLGRVYYKCLNTNYELIYGDNIEISNYFRDFFDADGIITVEEFDNLKKYINNIASGSKTIEPAKEVETNQTELINDILREHNKLHNELMDDSASYKAGVLMSNLKVLIDKLK